jgi:hypothetical protein
VSRFKGASKLFNMFSGGSSSSKKAVSGTAEAGTEAVDEADLDADKYVTRYTFDSFTTATADCSVLLFGTATVVIATVNIVPAVAATAISAAATATAVALLH